MVMNISLNVSSVRKQVVNIPSYMVRLDSQKHIDFSLKSPLGGGKPGAFHFNNLAIIFFLWCFWVWRHSVVLGRVKRKNMKKGKGGGDEEEEED